MKIYSNNDIESFFADFVGADVWVLACDAEDEDNIQEYYIKVHNITPDGMMTYNAIEKEYIDGTWALYESDLYDLDFILEKPTWACNTCRAPVSIWVVFRPLELMTTEEISEILHSYPVVPEEEDE